MDYITLSKAYQKEKKLREKLEIELKNRSDKKI